MFSSAALAPSPAPPLILSQMCQSICDCVSAKICTYVLSNKGTWIIIKSADINFETRSARAFLSVRIAASANLIGIL